MRQTRAPEWGSVSKSSRDAVDRDGQRRYRASKHDCEACPLKPRCTPKEPARKILRSARKAGAERSLNLPALSGRATYADQETNFRQSRPKTGIECSRIN